MHRSFLASPDAMIVSSASRRIVAVNTAAASLFGYTTEDLIGRAVRELYSVEEDWDRVRMPNRLQGLLVAATLRHKSGSLFDAFVTATAIHSDSGIFSGVIEMVRAGATAGREEAVAVASVAEDTLRLARGMAHDFNNLLAIIGGNVQLAAARTRHESVLGFLNEAEQACQMGARLTERLKSFACNRFLNREDFDIAELLTSQRAVFARALGQGIALEFKFSSGPARVRTDRSAFENAILNLLINARDAMPGGGVAVVSVTSANVGAATQHPPVLDTGTYLRVTVSDTGTGMWPRVRALAFDPFFTTKHPGRGTGLGLATVYGFAKQSGGSAVIDSTTTSGTAVSIFLPVIGRSTS